jgi:hypothetical protein
MLVVVLDIEVLNLVEGKGGAVQGEAVFCHKSPKIPGSLMFGRLSGYDASSARLTACGDVVRGNAYFST